MLSPKGCKLHRIRIDKSPRPGVVIVPGRGVSCIRFCPVIRSRACLVIVPVRGVSCINRHGAEHSGNSGVIVPVRGVSCIRTYEHPMPLYDSHRPREGSELHLTVAASVAAWWKSSSP